MALSANKEEEERGGVGKGYTKAWFLESLCPNAFIIKPNNFLLEIHNGHDARGSTSYKSSPPLPPPTGNW